MNNKKVPIAKKSQTINVAIDRDKWKILSQYSLDVGDTKKKVLEELIEDNLR